MNAKAVQPEASTWPSKQLDGIGKRMKSDKTGVLIYYKHLKILEEARLTAEQIGQILIAAIRYDETGDLPQLASPLSAFFTMIKYDMDANREKWEEVKKERSRVGKLGGRPPKAKKPIGNGKSKITNRFGEVLPFPDIKHEARNNGFFIDQFTAQSFGDCGLDPEWMQGTHSFLEFAAERIQENYGDKPQGEQKKLFISAVRSWDELRDEYPGWKAKKEKQEKEAARKAALRAAKDRHPTECECGKALDQYHDAYICRSCQLQCELDTETLEWKWGKW